MPDGQPSVKGEDIRLGDGSADVLASHAGNRYTTTTDTSGAPVETFRIGHTLPRGSTVASVELDGRPVTDYEQRETNRGLEVRSPPIPTAAHARRHRRLAATTLPGPAEATPVPAVASGFTTSPRRRREWLRP